MEFDYSGKLVNCVMEFMEPVNAYIVAQDNKICSESSFVSTDPIWIKNYHVHGPLHKCDCERNSG